MNSSISFQVYIVSGASTKLDKKGVTQLRFDAKTKLEPSADTLPAAVTAFFDDLGV